MPGKNTPIFFTVLIWALLSAVMILNTLHTGGISLSTDDAMRLAETRDLLAGQSWFDTTQWRMNAPYGLPMHWSHLVDAGIGGLILMFRLVANQKTAELLALYAWPLFLLLPSLLAIAVIGTRLGGRLGGLFALLLGASCSAAIDPFRPGSIDHDNVQLALTLWMLAALVEFDRRRWAPAGAAILAVISLAIGLQTLPYIVVAVLAVALWWIADGIAVAGRVRIFGLAFAGTSLLVLGGATASAYRFTAACDTFSLFYAALGVAGGCGLAAIASLSSWTPTTGRRVFAFVVLSSAVLAVAALVEPSCLRGPYAAMDPRLGPIWFSRIEEVQSPFVLAAQAPGDFLMGYCYAALAAFAAIGAAFVVMPEDRLAALTVAGCAVAGLAVTSVEARGLAFALLYALPGVAAFVVLLVSRLRAPKAFGTVALVAALFLASDASFALAANAIQTSLPKNQRFDDVQDSWHEACLAPRDYGALAALPKGRILAFVDQGPYILAYTKDSAVSGPYHRDASGILDTYAVFTKPPAQSEAIVARRGIDYLAFCKPAPDYAFYRAHDEGKGILSLLARGEKVAWLEPIPSTAPGKIALYRVKLRQTAMLSMSRVLPTFAAARIRAGRERSGMIPSVSASRTAR